MYYMDGTRYDQVDGTDPVVPSVKEDGTRIPGNIPAGTRNAR